MSAPGPLPPTSILSLRVGAETIYGEWFAGPDVRRGLAMIVHGYAEHCGRYREVAHVLVAAGYAVVAFDMRGHGQSTGRRGYVSRFMEYADDAMAAWREGETRATAAGAGPGRIIVAHSNGSLLALRMLADPSTVLKVDRAVISSPFLALRLPVPAIKRGAAKVLSRVWPTLAMSNELKVEQLTHDVAMQQARIGDKLCNDVATARWFTEAQGAQAYVAAKAHRIAVPTLWTIGGDDPIADPSTSARIAGTVPGAAVHVLQGYAHEVFNETDRGAVFDLVRAFITA